MRRVTLSLTKNNRLPEGKSHEDPTAAAMRLDLERLDSRVRSALAEHQARVEGLIEKRIVAATTVRAVPLDEPVSTQRLAIALGVIAVIASVLASMASTVASHYLLRRQVYRAEVRLREYLRPNHVWHVEPRADKGGLDTDGDGVRDADDFCDDSGSAFVSGRATDFDGDGCADSTLDDLDRDNDGIKDDLDQCQTSANPRFESNINTDFDGDGCQDGYEDDDDDADGVLNPRDLCPHTKPGARDVDASGCSSDQRDFNYARDRHEIATRFFLTSFEAFAGAIFGALLTYFGSAINHPTTTNLIRRAFSGRRPIGELATQDAMMLAPSTS
ncbi:hypothetical protein CTAYLR_002022 [Chrysophaeum taylorii]|uniref:Uncharacterized protein n=1 Tax=Chrysophaeum taylorii TaxID=2483200 RepID=A0AAD7XPX4_9STRA|nr:hypothetical protein CTAYLR_002022 [Chrysophaeum taylorii]